MDCFAILKHKGWRALVNSLTGNWNDEKAPQFWLGGERISWQAGQVKGVFRSGSQVSSVDIPFGYGRSPVPAN